MGTATILGATYQTVIMPDGKEWMAENLKYSALGVWFNGAGSDNGFGRYYLRSEATSIDALLSDGWHIPTLSEWQALFNAAGGYGAGNAFAVSGTLPNWNQNTGTNTTGFSAIASGYRSFGTWDGYAGNTNPYANIPELRFWLGDFEPNGDYRYGSVTEYQTAPYAKGLGQGTLNTYGSKALSIRLVRDSPAIHIVHDGVWKKVSEQHQIDGGWVKSSKIFVPSSGAWAQS